MWRKSLCFSHKLTELYITGKKMDQVIFGVQNQILRLQAGMTIFLFLSADATSWTTEQTRLFSLAQFLGQGYPGA